MGSTELTRDEIYALLRVTEAPNGVQASQFIAELSAYIDSNEPNREQITGKPLREFIDKLNVDDAIIAVSMLDHVSRMATALVAHIAETHGRAIAVRQASLGFTGKGPRRVT